MNQSGQESTVFRFLVEAVMALAVLLIIVSAIRYFEEKRIEISKQRLLDGFSNAFQSPNGDVIERTELAFEQGDVITSGALAKHVRMQADCIALIARESSAISVTSQQSIVFNQPATINVYSRCERTFGTICDIQCEVSFAEPFS